MPVKWANVDPEPANFKDFVEGMHVVKDVVCRVDEEASYNAVPLLVIVTEDIHELPLSHREVKFLVILHLDGRADVRYLDFLECVLICLEVVKIVDPGVNGVRAHLLRFIKNEVRAEQAEVRKLISNGTVLSLSHLEDEPSEAATREQTADALSCLLIECRST